VVSPISLYVKYEIGIKNIFISEIVLYSFFILHWKKEDTNRKSSFLMETVKCNYWKLNADVHNASFVKTEEQRTVFIAREKRDVEP
jgi:hypothetical protein